MTVCKYCNNDIKRGIYKHEKSCKIKNSNNKEDTEKNHDIENALNKVMNKTNEIENSDIKTNNKVIEVNLMKEYESNKEKIEPQKQKASETQEEFQCGSCGEIYNKRVKFCNSCGVEFE